MSIEGELSAAEEAALNEFLSPEAAPPPAADDDRNPITPEMVEAESGIKRATEPAGAPKPAEAPKVPAEGADAPDGAPAATEAPKTDAEEMAAFLDKHKGKGTEEALTLAFQQQKRAERAGFEARQREERAAERLQQAQAIRDATAAAIRKSREEFEQRLKDDPDGATRELHDRLMTADEIEANRAARKAEIDAVDAFAESRIPGYNKEKKDELFDFAVNQLGFDPDRLEGISSGAEVVTLNLAMIAGRMIQAGVIDRAGQFLKVPEVVAAQPTDPRLAKPAAAPITTLGSAPARSNDGGLTDLQEVEKFLQMSDAEIGKLPPGQFERMMQRLGG